MSSTLTTIESLDQFALPPYPVRRWTVSEYRHLAEQGILTEEDRVELLEGWIVPKMTHNPPHDWLVSKLTRMLVAAVGPEWFVRTQCAISTADSEPEPDVAIVRGPEDQYVLRHPQPEDVALVVEVAETSVRKDRSKAAIYAAAGIPEYWIINLTERQVEVHANPNRRQHAYEEQSILGTGDRLRFHLAGKTVFEAHVHDMLPPDEVANVGD